MAPSTPPRSRSTLLSNNQIQKQKPRSSNSNTNEDFFPSNTNISKEKKTLQAPPETPKKNTGLNIPMTPATILHHGYNILPTNKFNDIKGTRDSGRSNVLLESPLLKFNGLRSPEFSPVRRLSIIPSGGDDDDDDDNGGNGMGVGNTNIEKGNVSRVLFPTDLSSEDDYDGIVGPSTPPSKIVKNSPGTPSHQIITSKQAKEWNNGSYPLFNDNHERSAKNRNNNFDSDDENDGFIHEVELENPFMSSSSSTSRPLSKKERLERHHQLIEENPDIENVITYVNKHGEVTKRRALTSMEKQKFKPKVLIFKENDSTDDE